MAKDNKQKIKLLVLVEMLRQDTDEAHPMSTSEICRRLGEHWTPAVTRSGKGILWCICCRPST